MRAGKLAFPSRYDPLDLSVRDMNSHRKKLEVRAHDTKPIWEHFIHEIVETRRELSKRLDHIEAVMRENQAGLRHVEDRLDKIESKRRD